MDIILVVCIHFFLYITFRTILPSFSLSLNISINFPSQCPSLARPLERFSCHFRSLGFVTTGFLFSYQGLTGHLQMARWLRTRTQRNLSAQRTGASSVMRACRSALTPSFCATGSLSASTVVTRAWSSAVSHEIMMSPSVVVTLRGNDSNDWLCGKKNTLMQIKLTFTGTEGREDTQETRIWMSFTVSMVWPQSPPQPWPHPRKPEALRTPLTNRSRTRVKQSGWCVWAEVRHIHHVSPNWRTLVRRKRSLKRSDDDESYQTRTEHTEDLKESGVIDCFKVV